MRRNALIPLLVLAIGGAIAAYLFIFKKEPQRRTPPKLPIRVEAVTLKPQSYPVVLETRGTVRPRTESTLIPEVSGSIIEVSPQFNTGEFFEEGDVLLKLDPTNYEAAVTMARAEVAQAGVTLEEEKARVEQALENWRELGRSDQPNSLVLRQPQLADANARIAAAQAQLDRANRDLERATIRAPYAGRILEKSVDVGQYVSPGTILARIYAVDYVEIRLPLTNDQLAFIDLPEQFRGDQNESTTERPAVTLTGEYGGQTYEWEGEIVRVDGAIDQRSRQLFVVAHVDDPYAHSDSGKPPLKVGLFVEAKINGIALDNVFVLPRTAVRAGSEILLVNEQNQIQRTTFEALWSDPESIIAAPDPETGLVTGALLCVTPISFAANGMTVVPTIDGVPPSEPDTGPASPNGPGSSSGKKKKKSPDS
ncbi:MAG: efflux RND transporter periplasmic adaptor subunit [Verrucomicrobiota bacterium]